MPIRHSEYILLDSLFPGSGVGVWADAFKEINPAWRRLGYRFEQLVPSYATAIGVSGDTPGALAELMGIIVNDGVRYPRAAIQQLRLAEGTPMETVLQRQPASGERVLSG